MKWLAAAMVAGAVMLAGVSVRAADEAAAPAKAAVESKAIDSVSYNAETQVLTVKFDKGGTYEYAGVPQSVYDALMKAESKGTFITKEIKGKYTAKKTAD